MSSPRVVLDLAVAVSLAGDAVDRHVLDELHRRGFTGLRVGHGYVFQRLVDGPSTAGDIATAIGVSQQAVSKTVRDLIGLGYVRQGTAPADRRRHPITLTARGRRAVQAGREVRAELQARVEAAAGARSVATALRVMDAVLADLAVADSVQRRSVPAPPAGLV